VVGMGNAAKVLLCVCAIAGGTDTARARFLKSKQSPPAPRGRIACYASSTVGTRYPDPFHLGPHSYGFSLWERNGIVYTCRAGHIDITHLRKTADWTAYVAARVRLTLLAGKTDLSYKMREPSKYHLQFEYPKGWASLPRPMQEQIATELAIEIGQYCAFQGTIWHEVLTWFGFKSIGFYSEYPSAFAWEDVYSNLLGTRLAARAMQDPNREYDEAMTALIDEELAKLGVQPKPAAWKAGEAVRGQWFTGEFLWCDLVKRDFDVGLDDGFVTPWLIPGVADCPDQTPVSYPVPTLSSLAGYGFSVKFEIEPKEWERKEILRIVYPDPHEGNGRIEPAKHYPAIVEYIRAQAIRRYGPYVDDCNLPPDRMRQLLASRPARPSETVPGPSIPAEASFGADAGIPSTGGENSPGASDSSPPARR
jgi:hypothetical protein